MRGEGPLTLDCGKTGMPKRKLLGPDMVPVEGNELAEGNPGAWVGRCCGCASSLEFETISQKCCGMESR